MADNVHGSFCKWYPPIMGGADNVQLDKNTTTGAGAVVVTVFPYRPVLRVRRR